MKNKDLSEYETTADLIDKHVRISPRATIEFIENHESLEIPEKDKIL